MLRRRWFEDAPGVIVPVTQFQPHVRVQRCSGIAFVPCLAMRRKRRSLAFSDAAESSRVRDHDPDQRCSGIASPQRAQRSREVVLCGVFDTPVGIGSLVVVRAVVVRVSWSWASRKTDTM